MCFAKFGISEVQFLRLKFKNHEGPEARRFEDVKEFYREGKRALYRFRRKGSSVVCKKITGL
jgi:hypothetical protein